MRNDASEAGTVGCSDAVKEDAGDCDVAVVEVAGGCDLVEAVVIEDAVDLAREKNSIDISIITS